MADLIEQDILVWHNHDELVALRATIHDAVLIFCFRQRKHVRNAPVIKPESSKPRDVHLLSDEPCSCIAVDTDELPTCVGDFLN